MAGNITFSMIKPYAVKMGLIGPILAIINEGGFKISAIKSEKLSLEQAEEFYIIHHSKPFYNDLVEFMSSGPIVAMILKKENAVEDFRQLIGSTDPAKAEAGTVRGDFGLDIEHNSVHGSDSVETAEKEIRLFFTGDEIF